MGDEPQFPRGFDPNEPSRGPTKRDWDAYCSSVHPSDSIAGFDGAMDAFEERVLAAYRDIHVQPMVQPTPRTVHEWIVELAKLPPQPKIEIVCHESKEKIIIDALLQHGADPDDYGVTVSTLVEPDQMYVMIRPLSAPYTLLPVDWNLTE